MPKNKNNNSTSNSIVFQARDNSQESQYFSPAIKQFSNSFEFTDSELEFQEIEPKITNSVMRSKEFSREFWNNVNSNPYQQSGLFNSILRFTAITFVIAGLFSVAGMGFMNYASINSNNAQASQVVFR
jgi:hypothetical protein